MLSQTRIKVRLVLRQLPAFLDRHYLNAQVWSESDIQALMYYYLVERLTLRKRGWAIGRERVLWGKSDLRPDALCYFYSRLEDYIKKNNEPCLVAAIEIKFCEGISAIEKDLKKLEKIQQMALRMRQDKQDKKKEKILVWMVFGDHFDPKIHKKNYDSQRDREEYIKAWVRKDPRTRGCTILKFGTYKADPQKREALNRAGYWALDTEGTLKWK